MVRRLVSAYKQVKIGDPLVKGNLCGPLHTVSAVESYKAAIAEAKELVSVGYCRLWVDMYSNVLFTEP